MARTAVVPPTKLKLHSSLLDELGHAKLFLRKNTDLIMTRSHLSTTLRGVIASVAFLTVLTGCVSVSDKTTETQPVKVKIIALNDLHGYLIRAENAQVSLIDQDSPKGVARVEVGGISYAASLIKKLKAENPNSIFVGVGDLIGGSPAISSFTQDEATINILGQLGMEVSVVGNHEFDKGKQELKRIQHGGCAPGKEIGRDTCVLNNQFPGAKFQYLAANVIDNQTQKTLFPSTFLKEFGNLRVGFVGVTLRDTPKATRGANDLIFTDEITVINSNASDLKKQGAEAVVVLLHQGGGTKAKTLNDKRCPDITGPILTIIQGLKNVDVVLSGHTHREYVCIEPKTGILFTQADYYGNVVTDMNLEIVPGKGVISKTADNIPVITDQNKHVPRGYVSLKKDPEIDLEVQRYDRLSQKRRSEVQGYIAVPMPLITIPGANSRNNMAEQDVGNVMADAFLASAPESIRADIALINPGGVRSGLRQSGAVTYDDIFAVAPFGNNLFYIDLTGEQLVRLLEQQWEKPNCDNKPLIIQNVNLCGRLLQPSSSLTYAWDVRRGPGKDSGKGDLVVIESVRIGPNQEPIDLKKKYRIVTDPFLAEEGGDNFTVFKQGTGLQDMGVVDVEAIVAYFKRYPKESPLAKPQKRVTCQGCPPLD